MTHDKAEREDARRAACEWVPVCVDSVCVVEHPQGSDVINRRHLEGFLHQSTFIVVKRRMNLVPLKTALRSVVKVSNIWPLWEEFIGLPHLED